jgi:hypothetical protein
MSHLHRQLNPKLQAIIGSIKNRKELEKHILNTTGLKGGGSNYNIRNVLRIINENGNGNGPKNITMWSYNKPIPYGKNGYKVKTKTTKKQRLVGTQKRVLNAIHNFLTKPHRKIIGNLGSFRTVTGARTISPRRSAMASVFGNPNLTRRMYGLSTGRNMNTNKNKRLPTGKKVVAMYNTAAANYLRNLAAQR